MWTAERAERTRRGVVAAVLAVAVAVGGAGVGAGGTARASEPPPLPTRVRGIPTARSHPAPPSSSHRR